MKKILQYIREGNTLTLPGFEIYRWEDSDLMTIRKVRGGIMGPDVSITVCGLRVLLAWMDTEG